MTHACPNALSLAVAVAISSSIVGTQVLADRRLQIKSVDIMGYSHMKFTRSEVMVKPTLGDDQQPIPKSFTTTYPDQSRVKADYVTPAESFTDTLSETDVDVSSVDLFETGEDDVAQKYTKILKVGNEGIFKFTHNLEETELVIEVRGGMTDQASVDAVRTHWSNMLSLEPFTKIARPAQLFAVLDGAEERTGNLGNSDHYIALATIEVEKVEVNGRTFMRLISGGDQPPELKRLSQSLFVNDEALLAAATSAYIQLHVQGENLQQKALNELLAHNKPVGYVVHVEDNTQAHPVPAGYPKLEVTEASGEIIVFHGQKQNPADVAFVQNLYDLVKTDPGNHVTTRINIGKVKDYQYVIRCRQMALLEELAADHKLHNTEIDKCQLSVLTYYESLQQALTSAIADVTPGFEFTTKHIRVAASVITSTWLQFQLRKHFGFKPELKNLLSYPLFVQNIQTFIPVINIISKAQIDAWGGDERFASKVIRDMTRQLPEMYYRLEELKVKEAQILQIKNQFQGSTDTEVDNEKEKLEAQQIRQGIEDELAKLRVEMESLEIQEQKLQQESKRIPALERPLHHARNVYNSRLARELGIADWDDTLPQEEQARRITERINEILMATVATEAHQLKTVKTNLAAIEGQLGIIPDNTNDLDARFQLIQQHLKQQATRIDQKYLRQQVVRTETEKTSVTKARFATIAAHLNIQDFDDKADIETQKALLIQRLQTQNTQGEKLNVHQERILQKIQELNAQSGLGKTDDILMQNALLTVFYGVKLPEDSTVEDRIALLDTIHKNVLENEQKLASLEEELEDTRTPGHPRAKPEVLGKLSAVEEALKMDDLDLEDDEYYRHHEISREMQISITDARQQAEEEAQNILKTVEEMLRIEVNEWDDNEKRLDRALIKLDDDDVTKKMLDDIHHALWKDDLEPGDKTDKVWKLRKRLTFYATYTDLRASEQQTELLDAVEYELGIDRSKNVAAKERGKHLVAKLADDLNIEFEIDASLNEQKALLEYKFRELNYEVGKPYDDEGIRRGINNEIASHLGIQGYKEDAPARDQICLIKETLGQRYRAALEAFHPRVDDRIAVINAELDRQMARLGPKPRYVLDREQARARRYIEKAESELEQLHRRLNAVQSEQVILAHSNDAPPDTDKYITALNQAMKQIQTELGLPHAENQNSEDRLNDIEHFLQRNEDDAERQVETIRKLRAAIKDLKIPFENAPDNLLAEDCIDAIRDFTASHSRDEVDHAMGELPETRKKYAQVTKFLREHDYVEMELTNAQTEEKQAQEALDTKNQDIDNSKDNDPKAETTPEQTREVPDLVLKQKKAKVSEVQKAVDDHEADLKAIEDDIGLKPDPTDRIADRLDALKNKQIQLGGDDGAGGKILQLTREKDRLIKKVDAKKAAIETLKEVLKASEEAVEKDGGPFQYHPRQANILVDIYAFVRTHSLKKQALEAAMGLAESAEKSGKVRPDLPTFDFDDEFAPIRLRALVGDDLTFNQARRIVEVFKNLKTTFMFQPIEDQSLNTLEEVQDLADWARTHIKTGPQHYDDEIHGMGEAAIHYVEHEPEDLKSFSEYFATRSASGNRIIALLHEGLISKVELEHYIKTVRGVDGYQTVDEFEHFLGYKHGVKVPEFKKVLQMLSDKGTEQFMQGAFAPVTVTATGPAGMKESVTGMKEYAAAIIANYVLDDIAFDNGRKTAAFLTNVQDTLTPYAHAAGISESELIQAIHGTLMQAHAAAVERQLYDYWIKPSAFLVQAVTWYYSSYKPLLVTLTALEAVDISLSNMAYLYLLDLTNRGDYTHRMLTPFQHWLERYGVDLERTSQYDYHREIEQISELGGLAMPLGKAASSVILLKTGSLLFARQYDANPHRYRSIFRLIPEIVKSMGSGQGVKIPLLHRITPEKVKTLASATAGLVLGPIATAGAYAYGLVSGFTYAQTFGFALASSLTFDFFMNDNKMLTQWLGGPLGRSLDKFNRWRGMGETESDYVKRTAIATPQGFNETDEEYANRVKANNVMHGWTRNEHYLQFRERRDRSMKMYEHGWEKYFRDNVPQWSFSHAESIPYFYTLGAFYEGQKSGGKRATKAVAE